MKYYIIAGEASGDLHGSNLIRNLKVVDHDAQFRGFGGDLMQAAGADITLHISQMSFIGVWEVLMNMKTINKNFKLCRQDLLSFNPDALILVDYPGFNLKMAEFAKEHNIRTLYYIAPKVWASRKKRIKRIQKSVDKLYAILPFEEKYFEDRGVKAEYAGNPLMDAIVAFRPESGENFRQEQDLDDKPIIALLSGSRKMEINLCLPEMIKASEHFPDHRFVVAGAPSIDAAYYDQFLKGTGIRLVYNQTYDLLSNAAAAVVTSGTATLETALFKVPEVVIYKLSTPTFVIGRPFVHIRFFSLVNIIMDRQVVKELLQFNLSRDICKELDLILHDQTYRTKMLTDYGELADKIGGPGTSERVAKSMFQFLSKK